MKKNILIIDDSDDISSFIKQLIQSFYSNVICETATTNSKALDLCQHNIYDLIISDLYRPGGTGYEFMDELKNNDKNKLTPTIIISGSFNDKDELGLYRKGALAVLKKPFSPRVLMEKLNKIFRISKNEDAGLITIGRESPSLDYKERIELTSKTNLASFAKDVIGMANSNGGTIIIGVKEESPGKFEPIGIDENSLEQYEVTKLNKALFQYLDPSFFIESKFIKYASKWFCLLNIPAAKEFPILAKKQNDDAKLYLGRFYIRSNAAETCEIQTSNELRQLLVNFQEKA